MARSALHITYSDLIKHAERNTDWLERVKEQKTVQGFPTNKVSHDLECAKSILRLLKKSDRQPQMDLFKQYEKMK